MPSIMTELVASTSQLGIPIMVRVPIGEPPWINMVLDAGADGILAPQVNSHEAASKVAELARYPPLGKRGVGPSRATGYGERIADHLSQANEELTVAVQIESAEAVASVNDIASVEGLDMLFVGPGDLSVSLGVPGQLFNSKVWDGATKTLEAAKARGLGAGMYATDATDARRWLRAGFNCLMIGGDSQFMREGAVDLRQFRAW